MAAMDGIPFLGLLVLSLLKVALAFNLDFQYPIIFEDPTVQRTRETYFGYSVLLYGSMNTKSWIMVGAPRANSTYIRHQKVNEPGVVYKCPLWPLQKCESLLLDKTGNEEYNKNKLHFWDLKDGAWIGAATDVQPGPGGRVVICGPRWMNQRYLYERDDYYLLGVCYWIEAEEETYDGNAGKLLPLLDEDRIVKPWGRNSIFDFGVAEFGFSAHMPLKKGNEEGSELLLGAPGILNWRGGTILYEDEDSLPSGGFNKRSVTYGAFSRYYVPPQQPSPNNHLREFDYFGYQMNSGYFFDENELWYATSAPRATNILGKVLFYRVEKKLERLGKKNFPVIMVGKNHHVMGIQCGEYFGASMAVGKLNDDDYEDLVVGAPLYTSEGIDRSDTGFGYEEGRISVFFGSKTKKMREVQIIGKVRGARFGSAVSYLGDLDSDGFGEIAVGAPYENEGCGAVYIFSGSINGIITKPVQYLSAHDTYPLLRGFGSSINPHSADIDGNGCIDVAVGAYKSGHAVVFRGKPVVKWKTTTPHSTTRIPRDATQITLFGACVTYLGNNVPNKLTIWRTLDMDPTYKRCHIENLVIFKQALPLHRGVEHCDDIVINIKDSKTKNIIEPIEIGIKYQLEKENILENLDNDRAQEELQTHPILVKADGPYGKDQFCKECPISRDSPEMLLTIPYEVGCGVDEICLADLDITGMLPQLSKSEGNEDPSFVIGSHKTLKFNINVSNRGEPAYLTKVFIDLGSPAKIARIPPECHEIPQLPFMEIASDTKGDTTSHGNSSQDDEAHSNDKLLRETGPNSKMNMSSIYLRCDLDNPLPTNSTREILVETDMKNVHDSLGMQLFAYVTTVSNESNPVNNYWGIYIPFIYNADMEIIGRAGRNDLFTYFKENKNETESRIMFHHIYEVQKYGYSPVEKINIIFQIPLLIEGKGSNKHINFLRLIATEGSQSGQSFPCSILDEEDAEQKQADGQINSNQDKKLFGGRKITLISNYSTTQVPSNRTLYLNCSSLAKRDEHTVACLSVICAAGPFVNSLTVAKVLLEMELDVLSLEKVMGLRDIILLETQGFVEVVEPFGLIQPKIEKADIAWASTRFIGDIPKKHVESWVLALAIGGGILLLFFVAMAMHKAGFFQRKKKEELKSLKRKVGRKSCLHKVTKWDRINTLNLSPPTFADHAMNANEEQEIEQAIND